MVDLDIINGTIAEWESKDLTFLVVERLAWLYIVRDNALMRVKEEEGKEPWIETLSTPLKVPLKSSLSLLMVLTYIMLENEKALLFDGTWNPMEKNHLNLKVLIKLVGCFIVFIIFIANSVTKITDFIHYFG